MEYLSDDWIAAANEAVAGLTPLEDEVVVGYVVVGDDQPSVSYSLVLGPDAVGVESGVRHAGVTLSLHRPLAEAIATGQQSAQRAFLDGELTIGGDISLLLGHANELASVDDCLGELRAQTTFALGQP